MTLTRPRARDLGVPFDGTPGPWNAITDVPGVEVGHATLISGRHDDPAEGPVVRTGVTAVHPLGKDATHGVSAGWFALNGTGEMTGTTFVDEIGLAFGPIVLTNTLAVGAAHHASIAWSADRVQDETALLARATPIIGETWDGDLNDIRGFHVQERHVREALDGAATGPVSEGTVGGGTGMTCYDLKAGIGTASRAVEARTGAYTLGVLVQANYGRRHQLRIAGIPMGEALQTPMPSRRGPRKGDGSILVLVATDAPLLPIQAKAIARRASLGLGRNGSIAANTSGDLFLALSTTNRHAYGAKAEGSFAYVPTERIDPLFAATVEATEEAIVNALVAADEMTGVHGTWFPALPHEELREVLRRHGRLEENPAR
jgi:L-aminopeptidase/D-esterase-like protein